MDIDFRRILVIGIIAICAVAIIVGIYSMMGKESNEDKQDEIVVDAESLIQNFNNIFDNQIDYQENNIGISKQDNTKELVYTSYSNQNTLENAYKLDVNIPYLNINNDTAKTINEEINSLFYDRIENIMTKANKYTTYNVKYKAYVNDNILSLVITAMLEEGESSQRVIMKTYNYNLASNSRLNINEVLQYRNISEDYVQTKINETVEVRVNNNNTFININENMYKLENANVYFIGEGKAIYIIYPYGNQSYTSEMDLLVF